MQKNNQDLTSKLASYYEKIIMAIGEDKSREALQKTPQRAAKALQFMTQGYASCPEKVLKGALFPSSNKEIVLLENIEFFSLCEHHLLPIIGKCHVAYIPNGKIIGLSKIPRVVDIYARRLQVQENLTCDIAETIMKVVKPLGVGVVIEAIHLCMMARGVEKQNVSVKTLSMLGNFQTENKVRDEFLNLLKK